MKKKNVYNISTIYLAFRGAIIIFAMNFPSITVFAGSIEQAKGMYRSGHLKDAEKSVLTFLSSSQSVLSQAQGLKLLGIIRYTRGDSRKGETHFKEALSLDPALTISLGEVLDKRIIVAFDRIKARVTKNPPDQVVFSPVTDFDRDLMVEKSRIKRARQLRSMAKTRSVSPPLGDQRPPYSSAPRDQPATLSSQPAKYKEDSEVLMTPVDQELYQTDIPQNVDHVKKPRIAASGSSQLRSEMKTIPDPAYEGENEPYEPYFGSILPFGIGQMTQGRYLEGTVFAGLQGGLLFLGLDRYMKADSLEADLENYMTRSCSPELTEEDLVFRRCLTYLEKEYKTIDKLRSESNYAFVGLGVIALGGVIEAMIWEPPTKSPRPQNRKRQGTKRLQKPTSAQNQLIKEDSELLPTRQTSLEIYPTLHIETERHLDYSEQSKYSFGFEATLKF